MPRNAELICHKGWPVHPGKGGGHNLNVVLEHFATLWQKFQCYFRLNRRKMWELYITVTFSAMPCTPSMGSVLPGTFLPKLEDKRNNYTVHYITYSKIRLSSRTTRKDHNNFFLKWELENRGKRIWPETEHGAKEGAGQESWQRNWARTGHKDLVRHDNRTDWTRERIRERTRGRICDTTRQWKTWNIISDIRQKNTTKSMPKDRIRGWTSDRMSDMTRDITRGNRI